MRHAPAPSGLCAVGEGSPSAQQALRSAPPAARQKQADSAQRGVSNNIVRRSSGCGQSAVHCRPLSSLPQASAAAGMMRRHEQHAPEVMRRTRPPSSCSLTALNTRRSKRGANTCRQAGGRTVQRGSTAFQDDGASHGTSFSALAGLCTTTRYWSPHGPCSQHPILSLPPSTLAKDPASSF